VKETFEELRSADVTFHCITRTPRDAHQGPSAGLRYSWNTFRNHLILEYRNPTVRRRSGTPFSLCPTFGAGMQEKRHNIVLAAFESQREKHWFR